ncbi:hypothetical protein Tco_0385832 [Tanacetum coccineum]
MYHFQTTHIEVVSYLVMLIYEATLSDPYSAVTHFGDVTYQTKLNLTQPDWDAFDFLFKEDYTIVSKPRVVIYRDMNEQKKMMRETEFNPCMESRIWSETDRRRSKEFMELIERRLNIRRIFRSLESFVGGRLRDVDYRLIQRTK